MRRFWRNTRGQFVVIAALLIAFLTLSLALSIHEVNMNRQHLSYEPVEELVLGITSDLDRCLTHVLSVSSQEYNKTRLLTDALNKGDGFMAEWNGSILTSYANLGTDMRTQLSRMQFEWGDILGFSTVHASFNLDLEAYGFEGWVGESVKYVALMVSPDSIVIGSQNTSITFRLWQGKDYDMAIPNLTPESLTIWIELVNGVRTHVNIEKLDYLGDGYYNVTFKGTLSQYVQRVILLAITPEDQIYVETYYEPYYAGDTYVYLESREANSNISINLGKIRLGDIIFTLPNSTINPGILLGLGYTPDVGYSFVNWTTTGSADVKDPSSSITSITISGNCTIMAFYQSSLIKPKIVELVLDSKDRYNFTQHLGSIKFNSTTYSLPATIAIQKGNYSLQYLPQNVSYYFQWWEASGDIIIWNANNASTNFSINGNSTVTAVYSSLPTTSMNVTVTLLSYEKTFIPPGNLGLIQLGNNIFKLPNSTTVMNGTYGLSYYPAGGYTFINWITTAGLKVEGPYSPLTTITINENGTITAVYNSCKTFLDSMAWDYSSQSLGRMTLGTTTYKLPKLVTGLITGDYALQYLPDNDSLIFQWWKVSGDIIVWNTSKANTQLTVLGDGNITAVYSIWKPPPPYVGDWSTLYVDSGYSLMPKYLMSGKSSHLPSRYSTGTGKQIAWCSSPPTPELHLASLVNVTLYLRVNPYWNVKDVTLELGFNYSGKYYLLGSQSFAANTNDVYSMTVEIINGQFPAGYFGVIPEGSEIVLTVTVTFIEQPWGTLALYYGPKNPSRIELF